MNYLAVVCVLLSGASSGVLGLGTGAPYAACETMTPLHGDNNPQTGPSPYDVDVSALEDNRYGGEHPHVISIDYLVNAFFIFNR